MADVLINGQQDLEDLVQNNAENIVVQLHRLGALNTSPAAADLPLPLVFPTTWSCPKLDTLLGLSELTLQLEELRDDLLPIIQQAGDNAALHGQVLRTFMRIRWIGGVLKETKKFIPGCKGQLLQRATSLGHSIWGNATNVMQRAQTVAVFRQGHQGRLNSIAQLLGTHMDF